MNIGLSQRKQSNDVYACIELITVANHFTCRLEIKFLLRRIDPNDLFRNDIRFYSNERISLRIIPFKSLIEQHTNCMSWYNLYRIRITKRTIILARCNNLLLLLNWKLIYYMLTSNPNWSNWKWWENHKVQGAQKNHLQGKFRCGIRLILKNGILTLK